MKYEWKKHEKLLYLPQVEPVVIQIPKQKFLMLSGKGNPNNELFAEAVGVLYSLAYGIRMMPKQGFTPEGYFEYTVYPLEGVWNLSETGKVLDRFNKNELLYTIMIRQPDFVTEDVVKRAFENVRKKKPHALLDSMTFDTIEDGLSVQMLHVGSFDEEPTSFKLMNEYMLNNNLVRTSKQHREIYISDIHKTASSKLKTVLRYSVNENSNN